MRTRRTSRRATSIWEPALEGGGNRGVERPGKYQGIRIISRSPGRRPVGRAESHCYRAAVQGAWMAIRWTWMWSAVSSPITRSTMRRISHVISDQIKTTASRVRENNHLEEVHGRQKIQGISACPIQYFTVAGSAMTAQNQRLNVVASNLANADSAVSSNGQPYKAEAGNLSALSSGTDPHGMPTVIQRGKGIGGHRGSVADEADI